MLLKQLPAYIPNNVWQYHVLKTTSRLDFMEEIHWRPVSS